MTRTTLWIGALFALLSLSAGVSRAQDCKPSGLQSLTPFLGAWDDRDRISVLIEPTQWTTRSAAVGKKATKPVPMRIVPGPLKNHDDASQIGVECEILTAAEVPKFIGGFFDQIPAALRGPNDARAAEDARSSLQHPPYPMLTTTEYDGRSAHYILISEGEALLITTGEGRVTVAHLFHSD